MIRRCFLNIALSILLGFGTGASAHSIAELLEKAIYEEETVGDLGAAIEIYRGIAENADAERPHVAQALYRLGQCQRKSGQEQHALDTFRKIEELYPDQAEWVARARAELPESAADEPALAPAPWEDGELLRFVVRSKQGAALGNVTYSARSAMVGGRAAWRVESFMGLPKAELAKYVRMDLDRDSFVPLQTDFYHSQLGALTADWVDGERRIMMNRPGGEPEPFTQKLHGVTFDNEQVLYLSRRLPMEVGHRTSIQITGRPGITAAAVLEVEGIDTVTVPAGTFECYRVEIGVPPYVETHWFSTGADRTVVKVENSEIIVELLEIDRLPGGSWEFEEARTGMRLTVPGGWDVQQSSFRFAEHEYFLLIFPPGMKAKAAAVGQRLDREMTAREFAEMDLEIYRSRRSSYRIVEGSWVELEVDGAPAVGVTATLRTENQEQREYRVYVAGPKGYHWFIYRATPDRFDELRDEFDRLVESVKLK